MIQNRSALSGMRGQMSRNLQYNITLDEKDYQRKILKISNFDIFFDIN